MKVAANPWMKFYPSDWRSDAMLRLCSIGARGLWTEMLCLMHEAEPYGSLLVNGRRIDKKQLAGLAGISEKDCSTLLLELEGYGVFSRDDDGTIYSRRMRRDHEKSEEGRRQIAKRWGSNNDGRAPNRSPTRETDGEPNTQKPEPRSQKPEKKEPRDGAGLSGYGDEFETEFWPRFPNKVGKQDALRAFCKARKSGINLETIISGMDAYILAKPPDRSWMNPATFINGARWNDQPATTGGHHAAAKSGTSLLDALDRAIDQSVSEDAHFEASAYPVHLLSH